MKGPCRDKHNVLAGLFDLFFYKMSSGMFLKTVGERKSFINAGAESAGTYWNDCENYSVYHQLLVAVVTKFPTAELLKFATIKSQQQQQQQH